MDVSNVLTDSSSMGVGNASSIPSILSNDDLSWLDLPGQLDSIPGGYSNPGAYPGGASDPSGINSLFLDSSINPNPTGGYMSTLASIATAAASGFSTYAKGSPSVATPRPLMPGSTITASAATGKTNWLLIGGVVLVGVVALAWMVKA